MTRLFASLALALSLALTVAVSAPAVAQDALAQAKAAGQIGERPDGLVGFLPGAPASAERLVQQVNAQRLARYRDIAKSNGTTLEQVQAVAGKQLVERTPPGQFVEAAPGRWVRK